MSQIYFIIDPTNLKSFFIKFLLSCTVLFLLNSCSNNEEEQTAPIKENVIIDYQYSANETELVNLINNYRISLGLNILILDNYVSKISDGHGEYMISKNQISHDLFEIRYKNIVETQNAKKVAENVAYKFNSSQSTLNAWINSPEHKVNLQGDFTHFGISVKTNSNGVKFYTNIFMKK